MTHTLYHGSSQDFNAFEHQRQSTNGHAQGFGIYLTSSKEQALSYARTGIGNQSIDRNNDSSGYVYRVDSEKIEHMRKIDGEHTTLSQGDVVSLLKSINDVQEYPYTLTDYFGDDLEPGWGEENQEAANQVAQNLLDQNDNDLDIINELNNTSDETEALAKGLTKLNIGSTEDFSTIDDKGNPAVVVFDPSNMNITQKIPVEEFEKEYFHDLDLENQPSISESLGMTPEELSEEFSYSADEGLDSEQADLAFAESQMNSEMHF